ncbi:triacylglycerol lipase [Capronia coronata CBS 617.96]|uniref:Triacylglycerol lipase n=1 Tax=Capronia coronata CBS 617.96 TaxID=1182541 RepID=W9XSG5_9EURO|nr:triacylglycerol lipase [Capronia coronata CBS 617.96]EXJ83487.1 triacylglycerol lipase [Capronia coronata CBS 617.96]
MSLSNHPQPPYPLHESIKDKIHPEYAKFYNEHIINAQQVHYQPVEASRVGGKLIPGGGDPLPVGKTQDIALKRQASEGPDVQIRCFTPEGDPPANGWPVMIYYHGGGWVLGNINTENTVCTNLCARANYVVITTDYRLAPESPWPAAVHDSWETVLWVFGQGKSILSLDLSNVAIGGSSAGGNLAAIMSHKALTYTTTKISFTVQLLVVPVTDNTASVDSNPTYKSNEFTAALPAVKMLWYRRHYLPNEKDWSDPEASPIFYPSENFAKLPPAVVLVGELDVLKHEGEAYAQKLKDAGVAAEVHVMEGMPHPFLAMDAVLEAGRTAITILCQSLQKALSKS